jgi:hypothetical protein
MDRPNFALVSLSSDGCDGAVNDAFFITAIPGS